MEDLLPSYYHYLQFAYFKRKWKKKCQWCCQKTILWKIKKMFFFQIKPFFELSPPLFYAIKSTTTMLKDSLTFVS